MYSTTHYHHLSLHKESVLKNIKPEHKILCVMKDGESEL